MSSMILTCTASIFPAAKAAKVTGSRPATARAYSISPAADSQDSRNAAASSSAAKSDRRGRDANSASAAIRAQASRDSIRRAPDRNPISWSSDSPASPAPSGPAAVSSTMASSGPGAIVPARPSSANPSRDRSSAGAVTYRPCGMPSPASQPSSSPSPGSLEPGDLSGTGDSAADMAHLAGYGKGFSGDVRQRTIYHFTRSTSSDNRTEF
jgi:hypothetical protein